MTRTREKNTGKCKLCGKVIGRSRHHLYHDKCWETIQHLRMRRHDE